MVDEAVMVRLVVQTVEGDSCCQGRGLLLLRDAALAGVNNEVQVTVEMEKEGVFQGKLRLAVALEECWEQWFWRSAGSRGSGGVLGAVVLEECWEQWFWRSAGSSGL
jgi:hypothetical protein